MKKFLKILGGLIITVILVILGGVAYLYFHFDEEGLTKEVKSLLVDVLGTEVELKTCKIDPWAQELELYGLNIKDQKKVDMLHVDTLELSVDVMELLKNKVLIYGFELGGAHINLYKERPDTAANYQFAYDAIIFISKDFQPSEKAKEKKKQILVDLRRCNIENSSIKWDVKSAPQLNTPTNKEIDRNHIFVKDVTLDVKFQSGGTPETFIGNLKEFLAQEQNSQSKIEIEDVDFNGKEKTFSLDEAMFKYQDKELTLSNIQADEENDSLKLTCEKIEAKYRDSHITLNNIQSQGSIKDTSATASIENIEGNYQDLEFTLNNIQTVEKQKNVSVNIGNINGTYQGMKFSAKNLKGSEINKSITVNLGSLNGTYQDMQFSMNNLQGSEKNKVASFNVGKLCLKRNNHLPKRNVGKPNRGEFDAGHLNIVLSMNGSVDFSSPNALFMTVNSLKGQDYESGLIVSSLSMNLKKVGQHCTITNLKLVDQSTSIMANTVNMVLPTKNQPNAFRYSSNNVRAHAVLQNIARPFAKKLGHFTTPVELTTNVTGDKTGMQFSNIHVWTSDSRLDVKANGHLTFGKKAKGTKTSLGFNIQSMTARGGIKAQILEHFKDLSPSLVTLLTRIGDVHFTGKLDLPYHQQIIQGKLKTGIGLFDVNVKLSSDTHRLIGTIGSDSVDMETFVNNPNLGPVAFTADVNLLMKKQGAVKGAIPEGTVKGKAIKASYKKLKIKNIDFSVSSDGKNVTGNLASNHQLVNVSADFSFTGADIRETLKVKPHIHINNLIDNTFLGKIFKKKKKKDKK